MWYKGGFFKYSTGFILVLLIIFLLGQVDFIFTPMINALMVVALPLIITMLFYYLLRPLVHFLMKKRVPKLVAIFASFLTTIALLVLIGILAGNTIINEFNQFLIEELPRVVNVSEMAITDLIKSGNLDFLATDDAIQRASNFFEKSLPVIGESVFSGISTVASTVTALLIVPFILFYFLKDDKIFARKIINFFPKDYKDEARDILVDIDNTLSSYITGQAIVCLIIGVFMYFGYTVIGLKYALVLALFSMITAIIPFLGPILGIIPAILVGLSYNYVMMIKILIVMIIVQQLEGNLITPQIMGKRIQTHPVTIIMVILISASLFGFAGILLAIPTYAVLKVLIRNALEIYRIMKRKSTEI
ncbi:AI-2E family transporter [Alkalicella caledoniensis]|uniref:AI-2E family transporter n=1 Tax=Alkalicella caledoniensis TaxID=2731377 RepID=A0A7G9WAX1_ALKCA|nr:AI-2E family transporter [Alkalicella caledoniensis]QNO15833.1 AI-2E family transporter [Alkalicella caledoniensis]